MGIGYGFVFHIHIFKTTLKSTVYSYTYMSYMIVEKLNTKISRKGGHGGIHYNLSHSGGRGRKINNSRPAQLVRPYLKSKIQRKGLGAWLTW
jgi:hypothetical protein